MNNCPECGIKLEHLIGGLDDEFRCAECNTIVGILSVTGRSEEDLKRAVEYMNEVVEQGIYETDPQSGIAQLRPLIKIFADFGTTEADDYLIKASSLIETCRYYENLRQLPGKPMNNCPECGIKLEHLIGGLDDEFRCAECNTIVADSEEKALTLFRR